MLLLSSLKGTLFLFWIVTSYLMCAQIKTKKNSLPYGKCLWKHEKARNRKKWSTTCSNIVFGGAANGKSFFSEKKGGEKWLHVRKMFT
jgi:hypothetical protein